MTSTTKQRRAAIAEALAEERKRILDETLKLIPPPAPLSTAPAAPAADPPPGSRSRRWRCRSPRKPWTQPRPPRRSPLDPTDPGPDRRHAWRLGGGLALGRVMEVSGGSRFLADALVQHLGAQGVLLLGILGVFLLASMQSANAVKIFLVAAVNIVAAVSYILFSFERIDWWVVVLIAISSSVGRRSTGNASTDRVFGPGSTT